MDEKEPSATSKWRAKKRRLANLQALCGAGPTSEEIGSSSSSSNGDGFDDSSHEHRELSANSCGNVQHELVPSDGEVELEEATCRGTDQSVNHMSEEEESVHEFNYNVEPNSGSVLISKSHTDHTDVQVQPCHSSLRSDYNASTEETYQERSDVDKNECSSITNDSHDSSDNSDFGSDMCLEDVEIDYLEEEPPQHHNVVDQDDGHDPDDPDDPDDIEGAESESESSDDDNENMNFNRDEFNIPLRYGVEHSVKESVLIHLAISLRYNWSYEELVAVLSSQNTLHGIQLFPNSKKQLWRWLQRNQLGITLYAYCNRCLVLIGKRRTLQEDNFHCNECGFETPKSKVKFFIKLSLKRQLLNFLKTTGIADFLQYRDTRVKHDVDAIEDIYDGVKYKALQEPGEVLSNAYNYSYVFNTDGFKIGKSSKLKAWPILVRLNELPPNLRQKHLFLAGIWLDTVDPNMLTFMIPFVSQANRLSSHGLSWMPDGQNEVQSRFFPLCFCADAMARFPALNMAHPGSNFGCTFCTHQGVYEELNMRYPILPHPLVPPYIDRTDEELRQQMVAAFDGNPVQGVRGPTALMNLDHFDLASGNVMDDLHPLFEGAASFHTDLLITSVGERTVAEKERIINLRLQDVKPPREMSRKPLRIDKRGSWKGSEWKNWLLHLSIPCLKDLIPLQHLQHLELLSYVAFLLSQKSINTNELQVQGIQSINRYVTLFQQFFGVGKMKYNIHVLTHLVTSVTNYGPLWAYSTFNFESWNHRLMKSVKSAKGALDQMASRHLMRLHVNKVMFNENDVSQVVRDKVREILCKPQHSMALRIGDCYLLKVGVRRRPTQNEALVLQREGLQSDDLTEYPKLLSKSGFVYHPSDNRRADIRSDNSIIYSWDDTFCTIRAIVLLHINGGEDVCGMFVDEHFVVRSLTNAKHIACLDPNNSLFYFIRMNKVKCPVVRVKSADIVYVSPFENNHEID